MDPDENRTEGLEKSVDDIDAQNREPAAPSPRRHKGIVAAMAVLAIVIAIAVTAWWRISARRETPSPTTAALRLEFIPPAGLTLGGTSEYPFGLAIAPDGRRLTFPATRAGLTELWLHDLTTSETQTLPGTEGAVLPFWSPDGRSIGFFAAGELRVLALDDGRVRTLAPAPSPRGGVWHPGGDIIFAPDSASGLVRRRSSDGAIETLTAIDAGTGETGHRFPALLDGGRRIVFYVRATQAARQGIWIAPLSAPASRTRLASSDSQAIAAGDAVVYASGGALVAERIDVAKGTLAGRPTPIALAVGQSPQNQLFAATGGDLLIFAAPGSSLRQLQWVDRQGAAAGTIGEPMEAWDVRIAPGHSSIAVARVDPQLGTLDIWTYDGDRPLPRRISPAIDRDDSPVWSPDGDRVAWVGARRTVMMRGSLAELPEITLHKFDNPVHVTDWSADGRWLVVGESRPDTHDDLWLLPPDGVSDPQPYAQSTFNEIQGVVSPDGRWIAYASDESGRFEIYLDSFPTPGARGRLTLGGGVEPRWKKDGRELYFRRGSAIHAVTPVTSGAAPEAAASQRLFDAGEDIRSYDVTSDGQRFLLNVPAPDSSSPAMTAIVNVFELLPPRQSNGEGRN